MGKTVTPQKGDFIKIVDGMFKDYHGLFLGVVPKEKSGKRYDFVRVKIKMYGKNRIFDLDISQVRKVTPMCFEYSCRKELSLKKNEFSRLDAIWCDECDKKRQRKNKHIEVERKRNKLN